jgi:cytochrome oxidase Cu insertion factor (SCO1/SenC/PrrC family)
VSEGARNGAGADGRARDPAARDGGADGGPARGGHPHRRNRRKLVGLAALFFAPLAVAFCLYYGHLWHPGGRVNRGELIDPPRPLPPLSLSKVDGGATSPTFLERKWTFLYVEAGACEDRCRERLYDTRQVRTALDRDRDRVQRVFLTGDPEAGALREPHPDLIMVRLDAAAKPLIERLPGGAPALRSGNVYVIDPLGNLMMVYAPGSPAKGLLEDMKRLLKLSSIG